MLFTTKSLAIQEPRKLAACFVVPFHVIHRIKTRTYELDLHSILQFHPVFYVSLLKPLPPSLAAQQPLAISTALLCQQKPISKQKTKKCKKEQANKDQEFSNGESETVFEFECILKEN